MIEPAACANHTTLGPHIQDLDAPVVVGQRHVHDAVEAAGANECRVQNVSPVRCAHHNDLQARRGWADSGNATGSARAGPRSALVACPHHHDAQAKRGWKRMDCGPRVGGAHGGPQAVWPASCMRWCLQRALGRFIARVFSVGLTARVPRFRITAHLCLVVKAIHL